MTEHGCPSSRSAVPQSIESQTRSADWPPCLTDSRKPKSSLNSPRPFSWSSPTHFSKTLAPAPDLSLDPLQFEDAAGAQETHWGKSPRHSKSSKMAMAKVGVNTELKSKVVNTHGGTTSHSRQTKITAGGARSIQEGGSIQGGNILSRINIPTAPQSTSTMTIQQFPVPHHPLTNKHWQESILGPYWLPSVAMAIIASVTCMVLMTFMWSLLRQVIGAKARQAKKHLGRAADRILGRPTSQEQSRTNRVTTIQRDSTQSTDQSRIVWDAVQTLNRVSERMTILEERISELARVPDLVLRSFPSEVPRGLEGRREARVVTDRFDHQRPLINLQQRIQDCKSSIQMRSSKSSSGISQTTPEESRQMTPLLHRASLEIDRQPGEIGRPQPGEKTDGANANPPQPGGTDGSPRLYPNLEHINQSLDHLQKLLSGHKGAGNGWNMKFPNTETSHDKGDGSN